MIWKMDKCDFVWLFNLDYKLRLIVIINFGGGSPWYNFSTATGFVLSESYAVAAVQQHQWLASVY
jgi:hypothetical protein